MTFLCAFADSGEDAAQLLQQADAAKLADYARFSQLLQSLQARRERLTPAERESLDYLQGWNSAYKGDYAGGLARLHELADSATI